MLTYLRKLFSPPVFENDDEKTRSAAVLFPILVGTIVLLILYLLYRILSQPNSVLTLTTAFLVFIILLSLGLLFVVRRGNMRLASYIFVTCGWIALTVQAWTFSGLRDISIIAYVVVILASGLLIGLRSSIGYATLSLIAGWAFAYLETIGKYNGSGDAPYPSAIELSVIFVLVAIISYIAVNNINLSLKKSQTSEQQLRLNNEELMALQSDLEKRVEERTQDLEQRNNEIQTAAQIARDASTAQNIEILLNRTVQLIQSKFNYYHIGIFLIDDNGEYAVLKATGSEAGKLLIANKFKLRVGEMGIVGYVARSGEARIALDVGTDANHLQNPLLPYTRSEMAIPLKVENRIIGVLDIQSDKIYAFDQNNISIMQIITDQISVAIERTNLLYKLQQNTVALENVLQENTSRTWRAYLQQIRKRSGYHYEGVTIESINELPHDSRDAMIKGESIISKKEENGKFGNILAVPIRLRGLVLGALNIQFQGKEISPETLVLVEEASNRLALALENARLVQDAQRLALREQQINTISAQIQQSTDLEVVLQNTVRELGNTLGVPKTFIQIGLSSLDDDKAVKNKLPDA
jgi:GAF domain-containing protein